MTKLTVRVPITFEVDIANLSTVFTSRMVQAFTALRHSVCKFEQTIELPAETGGGKAAIKFLKIDSETAVVRWESDPELECYTAWNSFGQRIDARSYTVRPNADQGAEKFDLIMSVTEDADGIPVALCDNQHLATAIGEAFERGAINIHPRHSFP